MCRAKLDNKRGTLACAAVDRNAPRPTSNSPSPLSQPQALLLPHLAALLGERRLLLAGQLFSVLEQVLLTLAATKWQAMAAVSLSAFAGLSFPAISSLKSTHASAEQQGLVQGALAGIRALSAGLGPLVLAQLFAASTTASAALGYHPAAVFM